MGAVNYASSCGGTCAGAAEDSTELRTQGYYSQPRAYNRT